MGGSASLGPVQVFSIGSMAANLKRAWSACVASTSVTKNAWGSQPHT
jgi:hypothetical protein